MLYDVGALRKSVALLTVLAASDEDLGVSELAKRSGIAKNMAFRVCQTLQELGWVVSTGDPPRYRLTLTPFQLFARPLERCDLTSAAHEALRSLARGTGETAYLAVRAGDRAVNVQVIEGAGPIRVAGGIGASFPLHATAHGKVFLAWDDEARRALPARLQRFTRHTCVARKALEAGLATIRGQGWAANQEEYADGLIGCAAPVFDRTGRCIAAIGIFSSTATRSAKSLLNGVVPEVIRAAKTVSLTLGQPAAGP